MGALAFLRRGLDAEGAVLWLARRRPRSRARTVLIVTLAFGVGVGFYGALSTMLGSVGGFAILVPAVMIAAFVGGRVAGHVALIACMIAVFGMARMTQASAGSLDALIATLIFGLVGLFASLCTAAFRNTLDRLDDSLSRLRAFDTRIDETESELKAMVAQAAAGIVRASLDGRILSANARFCEILGRDEADVVGHMADEFTHPDDFIVTREVVTSPPAVADEHQSEKRYKRPDGSDAWVLLSIRTLRDAAGTAYGFMTVAVETTQAVQARSELRESEKRFRLMADMASSPIWLTDAEGGIEFGNDALLRFYGVEHDRITGHRWQEIIHPDDRLDVTDAQLRHRTRRVPYTFDARFRRADGAWRWMRVYANPRIDATGVFHGYVGLSFDMTESREALQSLAEQEARQTFKLQLADRLRDLSNGEEIMALIQSAIGERFDAIRVGYGDIDVERGVLVMGSDWTHNAPSLTGRHLDIAAFGDGLRAELLGGNVMRVDDVLLDERVRSGAEAHLSNGTKAFLTVPFVRSGRARGFLYVSLGRTHEWSDADAALISDLAERSWSEIERARARTDLRESEQRFRDIANTAPVLIWVTQEDRQRAFVNQAYVDYMGFDYETVRTADWRSYIHPNDQDRVLDESIAGEATRLPFSMEARYLRNDGVYRWLKSFSRPRIATDGRVIGFVGVAFDVTDIRDNNARLSSIVAQRDAILEQLAEGVIIADPDGKIVFVNHAAIRQHGAARLDVLPEDYTEAYSLLTERGHPHPVDTLPLTRAVRHGETITDARWRIRRPDGSEVMVIGNARPVTAPDGSAIGAVLTLRDETARIQAEHLLAESESRFRMVADSAPAFIWMTDAETRVIFTNRRYKTVFGADIGDLFGAKWMKLAHPDDVGPFSAEFIRAMKSFDRFQGVLRVNHKTLGMRWLRCEGVPRFDASGVFQGYVGASLDVTEAKQAEEDLKRINELLEERVAEVMVEKAKAEADLMHAQRMEAIGRLTGGVAHDFNNLLTVVIGALDMILKSPDDSARRKKLGEAALSAARRGERLTHQLLAFSRRQALRPEPVDLNALILEIQPLLGKAVGESVAFRLKLKRGGARVNVDVAQFEAALINLIVNARDAVGDKGRITVETLACEVGEGEVNEVEAGDYICIAISDNGAGMDPSVISRVFEPFFTTKAVGKGTGLGLSQVYGFARQSGGGVRVISTQGRGTVVRLYLPPLAADVPLSVETDRPIAQSLGTGHRLLLVEDDSAVAAIAVDLLEGMGLDVETAETAQAALDVLKQERFDVMLSDVVMPGGMTGIELAHVCAQTYPEMPIVLTSGYAGEDVDQALGDAPWPFLRKPYSTEQLISVLGELLPHAADIAPR